MADRRTLTLDATQRLTLEEGRDHQPRPLVRERCAALLKIAGGMTPYAVATHGLRKPRDPDTVYAWLDRYDREGLVGILAHPHGGRPRGRLRPARP
jgi:transposase